MNFNKDGISNEIAMLEEKLVLVASYMVQVPSGLNRKFLLDVDTESLVTRATLRAHVYAGAGTRRLMLARLIQFSTWGVRQHRVSL